MTDEVFVDTSPTGPATAQTDTPAQPGQSTAPPTEGNGEKTEAPYTLIVRTQFTTNTYLYQQNICLNVSYNNVNIRNVNVSQMENKCPIPNLFQI